MLREWAKDAQDMDGDMAHGVQSIPILIGLKQTQILMVLGFIGLITLQASIFPYLDQSMLSRGTLLFSVIVLSAALVVLILKNVRWPELISKLLKLFMLGGIGQIAFFTIY